LDAPEAEANPNWRLDNFLQAIKDPQHPEHEMYTEWIDGEFDPEAFDLDAINRALSSLK
jgi:hypothetical protein